MRGLFFLLLAIASLPVPSIVAKNYVVRWGDSYLALAKRFKVNASELQKLNHHKALRPGQRLALPPRSPAPPKTSSEGSQRYRIQSGDTWTRLSLRFQTPVERLKKLNPHLSNRFWVGSMVSVPRPRSMAGGSGLSWVVPVRGSLSQAYAPKNSIMNYGLLFKPERRMVRSSETGVVQYVGALRGYGKGLLIAHGEQKISAYLGLGEVYKKVGQRVRQGEAIGKSKGVLFFGVFEKGRPMNPKPLLRF